MRFYTEKRKQGWFCKSPFTHYVCDRDTRDGAIICVAQEHSAELVAFALAIAADRKSMQDNEK